MRAERFDQPHNAETRPEALFGVRALLQDQLAQRRGRRADRGGIAPDTIDRPVGVTPMAGRHVLLHGRMFAVAAGAQMRGDPLALGEDLDGPTGQPDLDGFAREAIGHAVIMAIDVDVIIDADPASAPFGEHIGLDRQRLQHGAVEFYEELAPCHAEAPDRPLIVDADQQPTDRFVQCRQAVEALITKPTQYPALHDQHGGFDLCLVARFAGRGRQDGGVVMRAISV